MGVGMQEVAGKVAVVTGGGSGIGRGMVHAFMGAGMDIVIGDVDRKAAEAVAGEVRAAGRRALALTVDVSDWESMQVFSDAAYNEFEAVHVLCNNAGVLVAGPILDMRVDDWRWLFDVNVFGVIHGIHAFVPRMRDEGGEAHVVNTGSVAGFTSGGGYVPIYSATKNAVVAISEALRIECEPMGIGVSVLCPSAVNTKILEAQRNRPDAFGAAAAEPLGRLITGGTDPDVIGARVLRAVLDNEQWIFPHPDTLTGMATRFENILAAVEAQKAAPT